MPVRLITPPRFADERGWLSETWNAARFAEAGIAATFVQDNQSYSRHAGTLRGLHFQHAPHHQAKLVRCLAGRIWDVAVDLRPASPSYGRWVAAELSAANGTQMFVPAGFAHGFLTLEDHCQVAYKVDAYWVREAEDGVAWDDPDLAIAWPLAGMTPILSDPILSDPILSDPILSDPILSDPILSDKDRVLPRLANLAPDFAYDGQPLRDLDG